MRWLRAWREEEDSITDRDELISLIRLNNANVIDAIHKLTQDEFNTSLDSGQGWRMPVTRLTTLPGWHAAVHTGQIDYLQTCWGDREIYVRLLTSARAGMCKIGA
jgi:hypothetical protein